MDEFETNQLGVLQSDEATEEEKWAAARAFLDRKNIGYGDNLSEVLKDIEEYAGAVPTGIPEIDDKLHGGFRPGVSVLTAPPSTGKTTLMLSIAESFSSRGVQTLYLCNDMTVEQLVAKCISRDSYLVAKEGGFQAVDILDMTDKVKHSEVFAQACARFTENAQSLRFECGAYSKDLNQIKSLLGTYAAYRQDDEPIVVVIDFLQNIVLGDTEGARERTDAVISDLKALARDHKLIIIAISSISRINYNSELTMSSPKESGGIEYAADVLMGLQYRGVGDNEFSLNAASRKNIRDMQLVILKHRFSHIGRTVDMRYNTKYDLLPFQPSGPTLSKSR